LKKVGNRIKMCFDSAKRLEGGENDAEKYYIGMYGSFLRAFMLLSGVDEIEEGCYGGVSD